MFRFNFIEKLKLKFNISRKNNDKRRAGVFAEGTNATFVNCKGFGPDAGMIDKGKNTTSLNSEWKATGRNK